MGKDTRTEVMVIPEQEVESVLIDPVVLEKMITECDTVFADTKPLPPEAEKSLREQQAQYADGSLVILDNYLQAELIALGGILYHAERLKLWGYIGQGSFEQWMESKGGALKVQSLRDYAKRLYLIKKPLELYEFGVDVLLSPKMSEVKAHKLLKDSFDWQRQESQAADIWTRLPEEQREAVKAQTRKEIQESIALTLELDDGAILAEKSRSQGSKASDVDVLIHPHRVAGLDMHLQDDQLVCKLHMDPDPSLFRYLANQLKGINWKFLVRGEDDPYTPEQMAQWLEEQGYGKHHEEEPEDI